MEGVMKQNEFSLRRLVVKEHNYSYETYQVCGYLNGQRIRRRFRTRDEALGEKDRLEIQAANNVGLIRMVATRLSHKDLAEAESCILRLGSRSLTDAVEWYLGNYRPPVTDMSLVEAGAAFIADRTPHVRAPTLADHKRTLRSLQTAFPDRSVSSITTADIQQFLAIRPLGKKRFNNLRGDLHAFFGFCVSVPREWTRANPVTPIPVYKISRGLPEILSANKAQELMAFVETYAGGPKNKYPPGFLVPYFALCLFAGIRPGADNGEIAKLGAALDITKYVNLDLGVIRIMPDMAKTKSIRQITIQPNLRAWLLKFPLSKYPIMFTNMVEKLAPVRKKFCLGNDVARHSFISYFVAKHQSMGAAALEAGNSESMIRKHYYNLVGPAEAEEFWAIMPRAT